MAVVDGWTQRSWSFLILGFYDSVIHGHGGGELGLDWMILEFFQTVHAAVIRKLRKLQVSLTATGKLGSACEITTIQTG